MSFIDKYNNVNVLKDNTWFKYLRISKRSLHGTKVVDNSMNDCPFSILGLNEEEKKHVEKYYDKKLNIAEIPLYFDQLKYSTKYLKMANRKTNYTRNRCSVIHYGQRKLLMTEVYFLSKYKLQYLPPLKNIIYTKEDVPTDKSIPIILYMGSAPGIHLKLLCKLFKGVVYHLYDKTPFDKTFTTSKSKNVFIYNTLFLDEEEKKYVKLSKKGYKIYIISDIRSFDGIREEKIVGINQDMQNHWITHINPIASMVKFRALYESDSITYLDGKILLQPWVGFTSTETRLIINKPNDGENYKYITISTRDFEEKMAYYNNLIRTYSYYKHPLTCSGFYYYDEHELPINKSAIGLDHCISCTLESIIWSMYYGYDIDKFGEDINDFMKANEKKILKMINIATLIIHRPLNVNCHGLLPGLTTKQKYDYFSDFSNKKKKLFLERYNKKESTKHKTNEYELY